MLFMETNQPAAHVTCAVCLNTHKEVAGKIARHGFHILTQGLGHGHLNAQHTAPCPGRRFPILEVSTEGTEWQLKNIRTVLASAVARREELKGRPALTYAVPARGNYNLPKRQWKFEYIQVQPGDAPVYSGPTRNPGYDHLYQAAVRENEAAVRELTETRSHYERVIAEWTPKEVTRVG